MGICFIKGVVFDTRKNIMNFFFFFIKQLCYGEGILSEKICYSMMEKCILNVRCSFFRFLLELAAFLDFISLLSAKRRTRIGNANVLRCNTNNTNTVILMFFFILFLKE